MDILQVSEQIRIGVGAVVFRGDDVLLIKRGKTPFKGQWSIPGGGLEYGERLKDAVIREVREETGIEIRVLGLLDAFDGLPAETGHPHVVMIDYVADWVSGDPVAGDDAAEAEFVSLEEAKSRLAWDVTRQAVARAAEWRAEFRAKKVQTRS
ncbi:NUDIX hydrolase [Hyphococcus sp.]|uniref:NUDIX hydrolase n=1 Tax=Hyphococcus sp. TaxID=2038636 RepID=UPI0020853BF3|nr:MAG: DNA mismatch repair protein MutT [Marinicaulis sp.]